MHHMSLPDHVRQMMDHIAVPSPLAVAVSGGADSLALALLLKEWAAKHRVPLTALVVDHGLRAYSRQEAEKTLAVLAHHRIEAVLLPLELGVLSSAVQEKARDARYGAMVAWCHTHQVPQLAVAHHRDDQAETVLMRLLRRSGPEGLAGMSVRSEREGVLLLRPLLAVAKAELLRYLDACGQEYVSDPSNEDRRYLRVRVRACLAMQAEASQRLAAVAEACGRMRHRAELQLQQAVADTVTWYDEGYAEVAASLTTMPPLTAMQVMRQVLGYVGTGREARSNEMERLLAAMCEPAMRPRTLQGCLISRRREGGWLVTREMAACQAALNWDGAAPLHWDRFLLAACASGAWQVGPLGAKGLEQLPAKGLACKLPRAVALTLPAIRHLEAVVCVPHMGYVEPAIMPEKPASVRFCPAKPLAGAPFWVMNTDSNVKRSLHAPVWQKSDDLRRDFHRADVFLSGVSG